MIRKFVLLALLAIAVAGTGPVAAQEPSLLFRNVRVFDGTSPCLSPPTDVLVAGNRIARIAPG